MVPSYETQKHSRRKRRRSTSDELQHNTPGLHAPPKSTKPFSRSTSEQRQLSLAGLDPTNEDPTHDIEHFPHRGIGHGALDATQSDDEEDANKQVLLHLEGTAESQRKLISSRPKAAYIRSQLDTLLRLTHRLLDNGNIDRSARLFRVILKLRPDSKPIDIRQHNIWAIGAEIIMRKGEEHILKRLGIQSEKSDRGGKYTSICLPGGWGSADNIFNLKAYLEALIQKHPYDNRFPQNVSALDFQLTLISCEILQCHTEYSSQTTDLSGEKTSCGDETQPQIESPERTHDNSQAVVTNASYLNQSSSPIRSRTQNERVRIRAYDTIMAIANKMDTLINELPFSKNNDFLQLRVSASLLIADFLDPTLASQDGDEYEETKVRQREQGLARKLLQRIVHNGGHVPHSLLDITQQYTNHGQEPQQQRLYVSLPIRST
ncbi:hypothetical protein QQS21_012658 [Conoideocrella luteorostrata]|uniref:Uncharacterized protein n=1 Tax=Conoideocrella luteorostrata TaxID=1105319 RepID=A0AAJ0CB34_9HYPO|nr:hypothetical protein QQS21_012658 [Conoideocrella luteorostrata]